MHQIALIGLIPLPITFTQNKPLLIASINALCPAIDSTKTKHHSEKLTNNIYSEPNIMYHTSLTIISVLSFLARLGIAFEAPCKFGYARAADGRCQIANKQISHEVRHGFVGTFLDAVFRQQLVIVYFISFFV